jgi:hypothetical protein
LGQTVKTVRKTAKRPVGKKCAEQNSTVKKEKTQKPESEAKSVIYIVQLPKLLECYC